jgi:hypothetical protein
LYLIQNERKPLQNGPEGLRKHYFKLGVTALSAARAGVPVMRIAVWAIPNEHYTSVLCIHHLDHSVSHLYVGTTGS